MNTFIHKELAYLLIRQRRLNYQNHLKPVDKKIAIMKDRGANFQTNQNYARRCQFVKYSERVQKRLLILINQQCLNNLFKYLNNRWGKQILRFLSLEKLKIPKKSLESMLFQSFLSSHHNPFQQLPRLLVLKMKTSWSLVKNSKRIVLHFMR